MTTMWIPTPAAVLATAVFVVIGAVHIWHLVVMGVRHRVWHGVHVLMAVGMVVMFWPTGRAMLVPPAVGVWVFAVAAVLLAVGLVAAYARAAGVGVLWLVSMVDLAAMAYMFAMMSTPVGWLSVLAAVWFAGQALGWAAGWLGLVLEHRGLGEAVPPTHDTLGSPGPGPTATGPSSTPVLRPGVAAVSMTATATSSTPPPKAAAAPGGGRVVDGGTRDWSVRVSLALMSLGMAYMLLAMQLGMPMMDPAAGMPGMAGM